jgi:hypothetical protein
MSISCTVHVDEDVYADLEISDIVERLSDQERRQLLIALCAPPELSVGLDAHLQRLRIYANRGDLSAFLDAVEQLARALDYSILDCSRLRQARRAVAA